MTQRFVSFLQSTPLHLAAGYNRVKTVQLLLQHGADVHAKDKGYSNVSLTPSVIIYTFSLKWFCGHFVAFLAITNHTKKSCWPCSVLLSGVQWPSVPHWPKCLQFVSSDRSRLENELIHPADIPDTDAVPPPFPSRPHHSTWFYFLLYVSRDLVPLHNACSYGHYEVTELLLKVQFSLTPYKIF